REDPARRAAPGTARRHRPARRRSLGMTTLLLALFCLGVGFAGGWWYVAPRRQLVDALARRSRVLYELAEGDVDNVAHELERVAEVEPGDSTVFLALAALDRRRGRIER